MNRKVWPWAIALAVFAADRITKELAPGIPAEGQTLIPGVLGLRYTENSGIAFSMLSGVPWLPGLLSLAVMIAAFLYLRKRKLHCLTLAGLMMMFGGAAGNMLDRFIRGYVPDMIEFLFVKFAVFNVADVCICAGAALAMLSLIAVELRGRRAHGK